jgi:hypothetical protein
MIKIKRILVYLTYKYFDFIKIKIILYFNEENNSTKK